MTNARDLKPTRYTKTTWDSHPASFLNAPRRDGVGGQGETSQHNKQSRRGQGGQGRTSAMENMDHPWKARCIWVLLGVGEAGALLEVGRPSCKPRHVSSGILRRVSGRASKRRRWRLPVSRRAYSKAPADKHRSAAHTEQRFSMAHVSFEWQDPVKSFL